jgi:hypothetical protein
VRRFSAILDVSVQTRHDPARTAWILVCSEIAVLEKKRLFCIALGAAVTVVTDGNLEVCFQNQR